MKAGYVVTAIDAFADAQTVALAEKTIAVEYDGQSFDAHALIAAVDALDLSRFVGFVYGSGFEAKPELLVKMAAKLPLIGNASETVAAVKTPAVFFAALQQLDIHHPDVSGSFPEEHSDNYLLKFAGGSGGRHIHSADLHWCLPSDKYYYQKKIDGCPVSLLFLANKHDIEVIGFNEQWLYPSADAPYRYGGAVCNAEIPACVKARLVDAAGKLANAFGLAGLNSLDAIIDAESGQVFVLEINPRLSATVDLYSCTEPNLFERHVKVCLNYDDLNQNDVYQLNQQCKAHAIVYAAVEIELLVPVLWPDWVSDTPLLGEKAVIISAGEPVCTVHAYADSAEAAKNIAQGRVEVIQNLLQ